MLYLYHGTTSVCAIKVRLTLAEKGLPWDGEVLWLQKGDQYKADYLKLNPNGVVPTLVHDDKVVTESTVIMTYLEDAFPEIRLLPSGAFDRANVHLWLKRVDDLHVHTGTMTAAIAFRRYFMRQTPDGRDAYAARVLDLAKRERIAAIMQDGLEAPAARDALMRHDAFLARMEESLSQSKFLVGDSLTLADLAATPYVNRCKVLGLDRLWELDRPHLAAWYEGMRKRPTFATAIEEWWDEDAAERFALNREDVWEECRRAMQ